MADASRSRAPFIAGLLALLAFGGAATWWMLRGEPPPPPKPAPVVTPEPEKPPELKLSEVSGTVEVKGADGEWHAAKQGDVLNSSDGVRTQDGSWAVLVGGEYWEVKMEPGTEVEVGELSTSISKILLGSGMAHATVHGAGRHTFEVKATKGDALARTDGGTFTISHNGEGTVAVGAEEGQVELVGKGRVVIVRAGQRSVVLPGQAPTDPIAVPNSLLLKVQLPLYSLTNRKQVTVVGQSEPGVRVEVAGHVVKVDATGQFKTNVSLVEGKNPVNVHALSVGKTEANSPHEVDVHTQIRRVTVSPNWGVSPQK
jgi:ferric-dicitrate binding protein FerR (iron transport regulator)